jgi:hypothetical protein
MMYLRAWNCRSIESAIVVNEARAASNVDDAGPAGYTTSTVVAEVAEDDVLDLECDALASTFGSTTLHSFSSCSMVFSLKDHRA